MICPFCEVEYPAGVVRCGECETELVEALPPPSDEIVMEPLGVLYGHRELELVVRPHDKTDLADVWDDRRG